MLHLVTRIEKPITQPPIQCKGTPRQTPRPRRKVLLKTCMEDGSITTRLSSIWHGKRTHVAKPAMKEVGRTIWESNNRPRHQTIEEEEGTPPLHRPGSPGDSRHATPRCTWWWPTRWVRRDPHTTERLLQSKEKRRIRDIPIPPSQTAQRGNTWPVPNPVMPAVPELWIWISGLGNQEPDRTRLPVNETPQTCPARLQDDTLGPTDVRTFTQNIGTSSHRDGENFNFSIRGQPVNLQAPKDNEYPKQAKHHMWALWWHISTPRRSRILPSLWQILWPLWKSKPLLPILPIQE